MINRPAKNQEEEVAQLYVKTKKVLGKNVEKHSFRTVMILGELILLQIQGTAYWMGRALIAEAKLAELENKNAE